MVRQITFTPIQIVCVNATMEYLETRGAVSIKSMV